MMKRVLIFGLLCLPVMLHAQSASSADRLFQDENYAEAQGQYEQLLRQSPKNALYLYRYARCAQILGDDATAVRYFVAAGTKYSLRDFFLGESYWRLWHFDEAEKAYNDFLENVPKSDRRDLINSRMQYAGFVSRHLKHVERLRIFDSVTVAKRDLLSVYPLGTDAGSLSMDSAGCVTFMNSRGDCKYFSAWRDSLQVLGSRYRLLNRWDKEEILPPTVNFTGGQNYPYCLNDGVTLYFAAQDLAGFGGWDIFVTRYNTATNTYTRPENVGLPFNSPANDYMLVLDEVRQTGYFATDRFSGQDSVRVYSFALDGDKTYLKDMPIDSLIAFARLRRYYTAQRRTKPVQPTVAQPKNKKPAAMHFVVDDHTVYTSPEQFGSDDARRLYEQYMQMLDSVQATDRRLEELRLQYMTADSEQKQQIAPQLLQEEENKGNLNRDAADMLHRLREMESGR